METKICSKCGIEKNVEEFYKSKITKDRLTSWCKECYKEHYKTNEGKQQKEYNKTDKRKEYQKEYQKTDKYKEYQEEYKKTDKRKEYKKEYNKTDPNNKARKKVRQAIHRNKLTKPTICSGCNNTDNIQGHHYAGYEPENALKVWWLCNSCHSWLHKQLKKAQ